MSAPWAAVGQLAAAWLGALVWLTAVSTALYAIVAVINRFLPRRASSLRYGLLALVLIRLVLPPGVVSPISPWGLLPTEWLAGGAGSGAGESTREASRAAKAAAPPDVFGATVEETAPRTAPWTLPIAALWMVGAVYTARRLTRRRRRFRTVLETARPVGDEETWCLLERARRRFGLKRSVRLVTSRASVIPFTMGVRRPVIFLPHHLVASGEMETLESVIAHELAHVQRLDEVWLMLQRVVQAAYFFHPIVWRVSREMHLERELDCDRRALAYGAVPAQDYGRAFLRLLGSGFTPSTAAAAFGGSRRNKMRLMNILDTRSAERLPRFRNACLVLIAGLALLPWAATGGEAAGAAGDPPSAKAAPHPVPPPPIRAATLTDLMPGSSITSGFGMRRNPFDGGLAHHDGVDLSTGMSSPVYAPRGGVVKVATELYAPRPGLGTVVIIDHGGGLETVYAHLKSLAVEPEGGVSAGDLLGHAGTTGRATGTHLHFEVHKDGQPVDPARMDEVVGDC